MPAASARRRGLSSSRSQRARVRSSERVRGSWGRGWVEESQVRDRGVVVVVGKGDAGEGRAEGWRPAAPAVEAS